MFANSTEREGYVPSRTGVSENGQFEDHSTRFTLKRQSAGLFANGRVCSAVDSCRSMFVWSRTLVSKFFR